MNIRKKEISQAFKVGAFFALLSCAVTLILPAKYESKVSFLVSSQEVKQLSLAATQTPQTLLANFLKNSWLMKNISEKCGISVSELNDEFIVSTIVPSGTVELKTESADPEKSIKILHVYVEETRKLQSEIVRRKSEQQYDFLRKTIEIAKEKTLNAERKLVQGSSKNFAQLDALKIGELEISKRNAEFELTAVIAKRNLYTNKAEGIINYLVLSDVKDEYISRKSKYDALIKTEGEQSPEVLSSKVQLDSFENSVSVLKNSLLKQYKLGSSQEQQLLANQEAELRTKIENYSKWLKESKDQLSSFSLRALEYNAEKEKYLALEKENAITGVAIQRSLGDWTIIGEPMKMPKPTNKRYLFYGLVSFTAGFLLSLIWRNEQKGFWLRMLND